MMPCSVPLNNARYVHVEAGSGPCCADLHQYCVRRFRRASIFDDGPARINILRASSVSPRGSIPFAAAFFLAASQEASLSPIWCNPQLASNFPSRSNFARQALPCGLQACGWPAGHFVHPIFGGSSRTLSWHHARRCTRRHGRQAGVLFREECRFRSADASSDDYAV
jgi:hypothetical protein